MLLRNLMLAVGVMALLIGAVVGATWVYRSVTVRESSSAAGTQAAYLVAARAIPSGALLSEPDLAWRAAPSGNIPVGGFQRGQAAPAQLIGAVARRGFATGDVLTQPGLVLANQRGFLAAALSPGRRAVTITADAAQSASGLVLPGDRVDVVLVQDLGSSASDLAHRSVGETVLANVRVVAIDRRFGGATAASKPGDAAAQAAPRTITLEVTADQAQRLFVAAQLGKLEISLRALAQPGGADAAAPTWAADVSPALHLLPPAAKASAPRQPSTGAAGPRRVAASGPQPVTILRGAKVETQ